MSKKFVTAINCMDGRTQEPVVKYLKNKYGCAFIDMITEAGPNKMLAEGKEKAGVLSIKRRVEISVFRHKSQAVAVVGHFNCVRNPTGRDEQKKQTLKAIEEIKKWNFPVKEIIGLWADRKFKIRRINTPTVGAWYVYILESQKKTLYTGITNDIEKRMAAHKNGKGARFTKVFGFEKLLYSEKLDGRVEAMKREAQIKSWPKKKKLALIAGKSV
ncbi:MAG: GIY-YIG nuclease family protein [Candidatus Aceula meridiana]|nr:GIY-YIG nuclease family protein [Candidatus Aceula meridiana]